MVAGYLNGTYNGVASEGSTDFVAIKLGTFVTGACCCCLTGGLMVSFRNPPCTAGTTATAVSTSPATEYSALISAALPLEPSLVHVSMVSKWILVVGW